MDDPSLPAVEGFPGPRPLNPPPPIDTLPPDPFASGSETRIRRWFARLGARLFAAPYLPGALVGFAALTILMDMVFQLGQQPPQYWTRQIHAWQSVPLGPLLESAGPLAFAGAYLVYLLIVCLLLAILNRKVAFPAWLLLTLFHFSMIADFSDCGVRPFYFGETLAGCRSGITLLLILQGLIWSAAVAGAVMLINRLTAEEAAAAEAGLAAAESWVDRSRPLEPDAKNHEPDAPLNDPAAQVDAASSPEAVKAESRPRQAGLPKLLVAAITAMILALLVLAGGLVWSIAGPKPEWRRITTAHAPAPRYSPALAYDMKRGRAVLFGGASTWLEDGNWVGLNDTWEWDGQDWISIGSLAASPPPRLFAGMAYDEKRGVTVLFGGSHQGVDYNDTWEWDGQSWKQMHPETSPEPRERMQLYYDPQRQKVVLVKGFMTKKTKSADSDTWYPESWEWDGTNWSRTGTPDERSLCCYAVAYNPAEQAAMFLDGDGFWLWSGGRMTQPTLSTQPPGRSNSALAYDPAHHAVVAFSGDKTDAQEPEDNTWKYADGAWKVLYTAEDPPRRGGHVLFYDATRGHVLLFGGFDSKSFYADTWELVLP